MSLLEKRKLSNTDKRNSFVLIENRDESVSQYLLKIDENVLRHLRGVEVCEIFFWENSAWSGLGKQKTENVFHLNVYVRDISRTSAKEKVVYYVRTLSETRLLFTMSFLCKRLVCVSDSMSHEISSNNFPKKWFWIPVPK